MFVLINSTSLARLIFSGFCILVMTTALVGCGGSSSGSASGDDSASNSTVAQVGDAPISRAAVSHWMAALAAEDYFLLSGRGKVPAGLVSDPPNYPRCVASLEASAASISKVAGTVLLRKCQQLYQALRVQAAKVLVTSKWIIGVDRELGVTATDAEVLKAYEKFKENPFAKVALATGRLSQSDLLLLSRADFLADKVLAKFNVEGESARKKYADAERRWKAKTSCQPGYVVEYCRQYKGGNIYLTSPSPSVLIEQVAALVTGRCTNLPACSKQ